MELFEIASTFCPDQDMHNERVAEHLLICLDKSCNKALDYWVHNPDKYKIILGSAGALRHYNSQKEELDATYRKLYNQLQSIDTNKQLDEGIKNS